MKILKKFSQLNMLATAGIIFVVAFGAKITSEVSDELTGTAKDAALNATSGIGKLAKYLPLLALVVAAAIIISVVVGAFRTGGQ
jgi:vacuolar-type H+-ATPase subunit I/STV1